MSGESMRMTYQTALTVALMGMSVACSSSSNGKASDKSAAKTPGGGEDSGSMPAGSTTPGCEGLSVPPITDYSAKGPYPTMVVNGTGSDGLYTIYRLMTDPSTYPDLLGTLASHGFVIIASNSTTVTTALVTAGLDWMAAQNSVAGDYQDKLNPTCLVTIGYSLGGGASVGAGAHANVVATASMHGLRGASDALHAPLLLLTSETDTFVPPAANVTPTFNTSTVQTFYATLSAAGDPTNAGHLIPVDIIPSPANALERAAMVAWLRLWVYSDPGARAYFYGDDCVLCKDPWTNPQRKGWN